MKKTVKSLALLAGFTLSFLSITDLEARSYWARSHDARVNTWTEKQYDLNHNGWVSPRERSIQTHARVNTRKEVRCDKNHNGWIGPREARCI